jgi:hypothetical protein
LYWVALTEKMLAGEPLLNSQPASGSPLPRRTRAPAAASVRSSPQVAGWRYRHACHATLKTTARSALGVTSERGSGGSGASSGRP